MHLEDNALSGSGACCLSGYSNGPFVVTDFELDPRNAHGRAYINTTVAKEIGEAAGCVRPETYESTLADVAAAHEQVKELSDLLATADAELEALMVFVGGKLGARANHIRKEAGFKARKEFDNQRDYINERNDDYKPPSPTGGAVQLAA